ncbi:hypothetical protein [Cyanothece sp. BG0011]|uniref:hypothetical protein n=1 Tax=Cyanothece sp. BG0011 TaxID=2082950 RepID=UPI000D1F6D60|nr:hypothetical protein [Cyanothece sp. BG0011]
MLELTDHEFDKIEGRWFCKKCRQSWKSKTKLLCPGVVAYNVPPKNSISDKDLEGQNLRSISEPMGAKYYRSTGEWVYYYDSDSVKTEAIDPDFPPIYQYENRGNLKLSFELKPLNLKATDNTKKSGAIWWYDKEIKDYYWMFLYDINDCEIDDPSLPPVYSYNGRKAFNLFFEKELKIKGLIPSKNAKPQGIVAWWGDHGFYWRKLYREEDCDRYIGDVFLTKTRVKKQYLLSEGWVKKIGLPDKVEDNPRYKNSYPMSLYSRQRIEKFLVDNIQEYGEWLEKREKYVENYNKNKDKIQKSMLQRKQCESCLRGEYYRSPTGRQFLCVVHAYEIPYPCPDHLEK